MRVFIVFSGLIFEQIDFPEVFVLNTCENRWMGYRVGKRGNVDDM